jgi:apolipoprotein N-acyltransferase
VAALTACAGLTAWGAWLLWIALVPWIAWLDAEVRLPRIAAASCAGTLLFTVAVFWWFGVGIAEYAGWPAWGGLAALLLFAPVLQPQLVGWSLARAALRRRGARGPALALGSAASYVAIEWLVPKLFADTLGHGFFGARWWRQAADLAGAPGLSFAIVLGNECAASALRAARAGSGRTALRATAALAAMVAALSAYGAWRVAQVEARARAATPLRAALVQADFSHYGSLRADLGTHDAVRAILDAHFALSSEALAQGPLDLIVWPETVYPTTFGAPKSEAGAAFDREIAAFALETGVPLVFGAYDVEDGDEYNAAVFLSAERDAPGAGPRVAFEAYRKASLFPLTERVPALFESESVRRALPWLGTWRPGPGAARVDVALADGRGLRAGPLICYDAVSPRLARESVLRGAEVLVTLSNDSWFAAGGGPLLHLAVAAFRSVETRRPQLRATNTGITAAIDATGEVIARAAVHERAAVVARVAPERTARTLALAWGEWLGPCALAAALAVGVAGARGRADA